MLTSIRLVPNLPCEYICHHVQKIVTNFQRDNPSETDLYLVIDIKRPSDSNDMIPKIEHKIIEG
jgi:hypothetical protein